MRTVKTAKLIRDAQNETIACRHDRILETPGATSAAECEAFKLETVRCPALIEQDFGFYEGKPFYERPRGSNLTGKQAHQKGHENEPGFTAPESKESMANRADGFLDEHLLPLFQEEKLALEHTVVVVSHGMLLSTLWRCLLRRLPAKSVTLSSEMLASTSFIDLEHLGGWSNTGYLELAMKQTPAASVGKSRTDNGLISTKPTKRELDSVQNDMSSEQDDVATIADAVIVKKAVSIGDGSNIEGVMEPAVEAPTSSQIPKMISTPSRSTLTGWLTTIKTVNGKMHLKGLKRTGGGVGSAKFEEGQKTMESFFKRRKIG